MKKRILWLILNFLIVISLVVASCGRTSKTTTSSTSTTTTSTTTSLTSTTTISTTSSSTASAGGNWWSELGTPQYGGTMVIRYDRNIVSFDPYFSSESLFTIESAWMERLFADDWTTNPSEFDYRILFRPTQYVKGYVAQSWDFTDPSTLVVHLRQGIHWQDIPPANGREFTANDVVFTYGRMWGAGGGFTKPSPFHATDPAVTTLTSVTASDKYTVVFKWKISNPEFIMEILRTVAACADCLQNPEAVQQWGDLNDWHHAIGTGPFILKDFVDNSSATLIKNPNYWGYDERYPQNKLPYIDTLNMLIIPDQPTALAGMRTGKIDIMDGFSVQQAQSMQNTNPEILQLSIPLTIGVTLDPRNDMKPFNDIRVREALQMAIDLPTIASSFYGGASSPYPFSLLSNYMTGWGFPYQEWPQDLKDEYAYNPTAAKKLLTDAGYPNGFNTDIVADTAAGMELLQIVKSYFADIGVNMDIRRLDSSTWTSFVMTNHKDDALAIRSTGSLGVTFEPNRELVRFTTGYYANITMVSDPVYDAFYTKLMAATTVDDFKQVVRDASEYVARQHFCISLLQPNLFAFCQPWLKGYNGQTFLISGTAGGLQLLGFYPARFWIDQNLKKSM